MKGKIIILEGRGEAWKVALYKVFKEKYESAAYVNNVQTANRILYNGYAVIDANKIDVDPIYIPGDYKTICLSICSEKEFDNCNIYYRFDEASSPSTLIDVVKNI